MWRGGMGDIRFVVQGGYGGCACQALGDIARTAAVIVQEVLTTA